MGEERGREERGEGTRGEGRGETGDGRRETGDGRRETGEENRDVNGYLYSFEFCRYKVNYCFGNTNPDAEGKSPTKFGT